MAQKSIPDHLREAGNPRLKRRRTVILVCWTRRSTLRSEKLSARDLIPGIIVVLWFLPFAYEVGLVTANLRHDSGRINVNPVIHQI
jgi:hypothetical protein